MEQIRNKSSERIFAIAALTIFIIWAVVGLFFFDDYGCGPDEGMERQTSLVNLKYVIQKFNIPISEANETWMEYLPALKEYRDRYYGTALHFPLVLIEFALNFTLEPSQFYGMRHFYTFFWYFAGTVCFFFLVSERFESKKFGLIGILMMILTPRFFAESFYNNKDVIFLAVYTVCAFIMHRWFTKKSWGLSFLLAFLIALTCNTRFNGIIFIAVFIFLYIFDSLRKHMSEDFSMFFSVLIFSAVFFYLITPNFWEQPIQTLIETLQFNMRHPNHGSDGNLFKGVLVDAAYTKTYIPTWIALTIPTVYLIFTLAGTFRYLLVSLKQLFTGKFHDIVLTDMMMFISGFMAVGFIMLTHVTIYNGWRHCYFAFPCIVFFAVYFLKFVEQVRYKAASAICYCLLILSLLSNSVWIINNHPFEYAYFVPAARNQANKFSGDYWSVSSRALLEYITNSDPQRMLKINHAYSQAGSINRGLLPANVRQYIELTYDYGEDVDYYIVCRDDIPSVDLSLKGYEKVYSIKVDKDEIGAVFKKQ